MPAPDIYGYPVQAFELLGVPFRLYRQVVIGKERLDLQVFGKFSSNGHSQALIYPHPSRGTYRESHRFAGRNVKAVGVDSLTAEQRRGIREGSSERRLPGSGKPSRHHGGKGEIEPAVIQSRSLSALSGIVQDNHPAEGTDPVSGTPFDFPAVNDKGIGTRFYERYAGIDPALARRKDKRPARNRTSSRLRERICPQGGEG